MSSVDAIRLTQKQVYELLWSSDGSGPCSDCQRRCGDEALCGWECERFEIVAVITPKAEDDGAFPCYSPGFGGDCGVCPNCKTRIEKGLPLDRGILGGRKA